jgi:dephospho-CoA kinase
MLVIGLTGGIASGKTTVGELINEAGYTVYDMDSVAKDLMVSDEELKAVIIEEFGDESYLENGDLNKTYLAETVFTGHPQKLEKLNALVHPVAIEDMVCFVKESVDSAPETGEKMIFIETALLFEAELESGFDYTLMVDAPQELRIERASKRTGASPEDIRGRMNAQLSPEVKRSRADFTIENEGSIEELKNTVEFILGILENLPPVTGD